MNRNKLILNNETKGDLEKIAKEERKSKVELARGRVKEGARRNSKKDLGTVLLEMAAKGKATGYTDLSKNHNDYLYGSKRLK